MATTRSRGRRRSRADLYYRLNAADLQSALRERAEDIPMLSIPRARYAKQMRKTIRTIEKRTLKLLQNYEWPGNARLQNVVERAVVLCDGIRSTGARGWETTAQTSAPRARPSRSPRARELIVTALKESSGKISGPGGAARKLGIHDRRSSRRSRRSTSTPPHFEHADPSANADRSASREFVTCV